MVCEWGMSEKMGPLAYGKKEGEVFLGREMSVQQTFSEQTARDIDAEVHRIVTEQYERAKKILLERREILDRIAAALLEYETLDASDIDVLMVGGTISRPPPNKPMATTILDRPQDAPPAADATPVAPVRPTPGPARDGA
jgi:cell division protease FtsH